MDYVFFGGGGFVLFYLVGLVRFHCACGFESETQHCSVVTICLWLTSNL